MLPLQMQTMAPQDPTPHAPALDASLFTMPFGDYTSTIPQGLSAQLTRSQQPRRLSSKSSTPSSSKRSSRITKFGVAGSSPNGVQRRRTTANHSNHDQTNFSSRLAREQRLYNYYQARQPLRPFSWHPGAEPPGPFDVPRSMREQPVNNALTGFEHLAVTDTPPSIEQSIHNACSVGHSYPYSLPLHTPATEAPPGGLYTLPLAQPPQEQYLVPQYDYMPTTTKMGNSFQPQAEGFMRQESLPDGRNDVYRPTSHTNAFEEAKTASADVSPGLLHADELETSDGEGEELIGIGLYDDKEPSPLSDTVFSATSRSGFLASGRDLKLEQTWQPPSTAEDSNEPNTESTEQSNCAIVRSPPGDIPQNFYSPYDDLSNQSFFFTGDDDGFTGAPELSDYVTMGNAWGSMDPLKAQTAAAGGFMMI